MLQYDLPSLPTAEELPCNDFTPVDSELQRLLAMLLREILYFIWPDRNDVFFGLDMAYYYHPSKSHIAPDAFLSIGVDKHKARSQNKGRLSYVLWEENDIVPILVMECVSKKYGGEYDKKKTEYAQMGILYYVIYDGSGRHSGKRRNSKGDPFEVHRLDNGVYVRQSGEPVWLPEIGLGIGRGQGTFNGWTREWLYWHDQEGNRYPSIEEKEERERARADQTQLELDQTQLKLDQTQLERDQEKARADRTQLELDQLKAQLQQRGINWEDMQNN